MNRLSWLMIMTSLVVAYVFAIKTHNTAAEVAIWKGTKYMTKIIKWYANIVTFFGDFWYIAGKAAGRVARWFEDVRGDFSDGFQETREHVRFDQDEDRIMFGRVGFPAGMLGDLMKNAGKVPDAPESHADGSKADAGPVDTTGR
jgi:hypothetical protein